MVWFAGEAGGEMSLPEDKVEGTKAPEASREGQKEMAKDMAGSLLSLANNKTSEQKAESAKNQSAWAKAAEGNPVSTEKAMEDALDSAALASFEEEANSVMAEKSDMPVNNGMPNLGPVDTKQEDSLAKVIPGGNESDKSSTTGETRVAQNPANQAGDKS